MPKVSYSEEDRKRIRREIAETALDLMARQGIRHTTVEQIYKRVGISRTFFYSFFQTKEDLIVEALYLQQPKIIEYLQNIMRDPALSWHDGFSKFLHDCCYGEKHGIAVLTIEEQQHVFKHLSAKNYMIFRKKRMHLFGQILETLGIKASDDRIALFTNLCLAVMVVRRAVPDNLPLFVPEAADETVRFQIKGIVDAFEKLKE